MDVFSKASNIVNIFDKEGNKVHEIVLPEKIVTIPTKRGGFGDSGLYYKGSGGFYRNHMINELKGDCRLISKSGILYEKYQVINTKLSGMKGVFTFPHQPVFSDFEGGCGPKEARVLDNIKRFELTAIEEVVDVIPIGIGNHDIYVYRYIEVSGNVLDLKELIEYILLNNFNTAWDKNLISDIEGYKYVRDLADWFISDDIRHKYGTVFALLYSLYNNDIYGYVRLIKDILGQYNADRQLIVYYAALVLEKYCKEIWIVEGINLNNLTKEVYKKLLTILFEGKACCHLEKEKEWNFIRDEFKKTIEPTVEKCWQGITRMKFD